jgi:hypothetical protein
VGGANFIMLLTLRKLPVIGLSFVHIINSNMRDIHTERSDKQIKTLYFYFFLLKIKFDITLNIHIYELIKQTLVDPA